LEAPSTNASLPSETDTVRKNRVVIIDDVSSILDSAYHQLSENAAEYDFRPFHYDLNEVYQKWAKNNPREQSPIRAKKDEELSELLNEFKPHFILMDWGYSVIQKAKGPEGTSLFSLNTPQAIGLKCNARDLLLPYDGPVGPIGNYLKLLPQTERPDILIYTYNPFDADVFEILTRTQDEFIDVFHQDKGSRGPSLHYIETSAFFNHPRALSLYRGWYSQDVDGDLREIGSEKQLKQYGHFLSVPIKEYLDERIGRNRDRLIRQRIFDEENLRFVRYKRYVSDKLGLLNYSKAIGGDGAIPLKLGALTFYDSGGDILLDIPRKDYYDELDKYAASNKLLEFLYPPGSNSEFWGKEHKNFLYVRLYTRPSTDIKRPGLLDLAIEAWHSNAQFEERQLRQLVSLLFSSVYYFCDRHGSDWEPSDDHVEICQGTDLRVWRGREKDLEHKLEPIDLFFLCQKMETGGGSEGWLNYTLYNDTADIGNLKVEEIESIRDRILFEIRPAVIAKAKDALLPQLFGEIAKQSRSASLSQVLSRTMSHNLGSHSLNALATEDGMCKEFEKLEALIEAKKLLPGHIVGVLGAPCDLSDISKNRRELLARYNNYLRERMDFLADITTAVPAFETRTHLVQDLLKGYADNLLLTTTIAGSPDFDYRWKVMRDGKKLGEKDDILVSIPSDVLGRHAFYVILENIVRNSSKHGTHPKGTPVTYSVEVTKVDGPEHADMLKVTIKDDKCRPTQEKEGGPVEYCPEHKELIHEEKKRVETIQQLKRKRNEDINRPVLENGRVRNGAWGMLEMKACAAYLRRVALEELDEAKYHAFIPDPNATAEQNAERKKEHDSQADIPLLEAVGDASGFGYAFYLMRPKDAMVIGEKVVELFGTGTTKEVLAEYGIGFKTLGELAAKPVIGHGMLVVAPKTRTDLDLFIRNALTDLAAYPHEIIVVLDDHMASTGLPATIDAQVSAMVGSMEANESYGLVHSASILKRSIFTLSRREWEELAKSIPTLYEELRHYWLGKWLSTNHYNLTKTSTPEPFQAYVERLKSDSGNTAGISSKVSYKPHSKFYSQVGQWLELTEGAEVHNDLSIPLRAVRLTNNLPIVQRYPKALERVMTPDGKGAMPLTLWAQNHIVSWFQGVAVVDERVQRCAEHETYQTESKDGVEGEPVRVKHLLAMGGVFVPPAADCPLDSQKYERASWDFLVRDWLCKLAPMLGYVCIHLTNLEKFKETTGKAPNALLDEMRSHLPGVRIIVVSGRGKPPGLPKTEMFMSFSALSQYTTQTYQRAPVLLNMLCHSTRRIIP
jgi:hypothetical protein